MKRLQLGLTMGVLGLSLGALGFRGCGEPQSLGVFGAPSDSPVIVRGGSVTALAPSGWNEMVAGSVYSKTLSGAANTVYIDGIDESGKTNPKDYPFPGLNANWQITLTFRNQSGGTKATQLQICTKIKNNACDPDLTVYLVGDSHDKLLNSDFDRKVSGQKVRLRSQVSNCYPFNTFDPECDHISDINVSGISGITGPNHCVDGACEVAVTHK